jgi:hypothetical protein
MFGYTYRVLSLEKLIEAKRAAGRPKDLIVLPELETILDHRKSGRSNDPNTHWNKSESTS